MKFREGSVCVVAVLAAAIIGCGGGGGGGGGTNTSAPTGNAAVESTSISGYQSTSAISAFPVRALLASAPSGSGLALLRAAQAKAAPKTLTLDPQLGLYFALPTTVGGTITYNFYSDANGTTSAGTMKVTSASGTFNYASYPAKVGLTYNVTAGNLPGSGSATVTYTDSTGANTMVGALNLSKNKETVNVNLALTGADEVSGTLSIAEDSTTIQATHLSGNFSGAIGFEFSLVPQGDAGTGTINLANGAYSLTFSQPSKASCSINTSGGLVITYADGSTSTIDDPIAANLNASGSTTSGGTATTSTTSGGTGTTSTTASGTTLSNATFATPVVTNWIPETYQLGSVGQYMYSSNVSGAVVGVNGEIAAYGSSVLASPQTLKISPTPAAGFAYCINKGGQIVGSSADSTNNRTALYWSSSNATAVTLPVPSGTTSAEATGINDLGQIVGYCYTAAGKSFLYWASPTATPTTIHPTAISGFGPSGAYRINDSGQMFGVTDDINSYWSTPTSTPVQLGTLGSGQIPELANLYFGFSNVGIVGITPVGATQWASPSFTPKALPVTSGLYGSDAIAMNDSGDITGYTETITNTVLGYYTTHIAFWQPGKEEQTLDAQLTAAFPNVVPHQGEVVLGDGSVVASGEPSGAGAYTFYYFKRTSAVP